MKKFGLVATAVSLIFLAGCATSGTHQTTEPVTAKLGGFQKMNLVIDSKVDYHGNELDTVRAQVRAKLMPRFELVSMNEGEHANGVLGMKLEVTELNVIGGAAHFFLGPLAGPDRVAVNGTLYDMSTGAKIGSFTSAGEARLGGIVVGNTGTLRASAQLGDEIADLIKANQ